MFIPFVFGEKIATTFLDFVKIPKGAIIQSVSDHTTNIAAISEAHKNLREKVSPDSKSSSVTPRPIWSRFLKNFLWSSQYLSKVSEFTVILIGLSVVEQTFGETCIRSGVYILWFAIFPKTIVKNLFAHLLKKRCTQMKCAYWQPIYADFSWWKLVGFSGVDSKTVRTYFSFV